MRVLLLDGSWYVWKHGRLGGMTAWWPVRSASTQHEAMTIAKEYV